jgi:hypothetical protein
MIVDADRQQCTNTSDCTARGGAFAGSICVDSVCEPDAVWGCVAVQSAPSNAPGPFLVSTRVTGLLDQQPIAGVHVDLCLKLDVNCSGPVSTTTSDATGAVKVSVPANFSGYLSLTAPDLVSTRFVFNPTVDHDQEIAPISLSTPFARSALLMQLGAAAEKGDIVATVQDCAGKPASNVQFTIAPASGNPVKYYLVDGFPSVVATATDSYGYGGISNLEAGTVSLTARLSNGQTLPPVSLVVAPGTVSWTRFVPGLSR